MVGSGLKHVLYVGPDGAPASRLKNKLQTHNYQVHMAHSHAGALNRLAQNSYDLLLIQHHPANTNAPELVARIAGLPPAPPIVALVNPGQEDIAARAIKLGAGAHLITGPGRQYLDLLPVVMEQVLRNHRLAREKEQMTHCMEICEAGFEQFFDLLPDGIAIHTGDRLAWVNSAAAALLGRPAGALEGASLLEFVHPDSQPAVKDHLCKPPLPASPHRLNVCLLCGDGAEAYVELATVPFVYRRQPARLSIFKDTTPARRTEQALQQARHTIHRYADIINNMQLGLLVYHLENLSDDQTLRLVAANPAAARLTGLSAGDMLGKTLDESFPDLRERGIPQLYADIIRTGRAMEMEGELFYGDNRIEEAWFAFKAFPLPDNCLGVLFEDITLRKQAEEALRRNRARYRAIVEDQTELVVRYLPDGTLTFVNQAFCRYYSRARHNVIGANISSFIAEIDGPKRKQLAGLNPQNPVTGFEHSTILPNGEARWLFWTNRAIFNDEGRLVEFQAVGRDITKRKQAEEALRRSMNLFQSLIDSLPLNVYSKDFEGRFTFANQQYCQTQGRSLTDIIGKTDFDLHPPDLARKYRADDMRVVQTQQIFETIEEHQPIGGEGFYVQVIKTPLYDARGRATGTLGIFWDITERRRAELERERLLAAEREHRLLAETLADITLALTAHTDHQAVLDEILLQAKRLVPYRAANIAVIKNNALHNARLQGYEAFGASQAVANQIQPLAHFPIEAEVIHNHHPCVIGDTRQEPRWVMLDGVPWVRSHLIVPICHQDRVLGLLRLDSDTPRAFTPKDVDRLLPLANAAAIALANAHLYQQARRDAETRTVLLNEVNHRVKNNLAAIIGLLYAKREHGSRSMDTADYRLMMTDLINRVQGLSTVHSMLSASQWNPLLLSKLAQQIIYSALRALAHDNRVQVKVAPSPVKVTADQANHLALVINELATNTVKHALPHAPAGHNVCIAVQITAKANTVRLEIRDNGPGYPPKMLQHDHPSNTLGFELVKSIVEKNLDGMITLRNDGGAVTQIEFAAGGTPEPLAPPPKTGQ